MYICKKTKKCIHKRVLTDKSHTITCTHQTRFARRTLADTTLFLTYRGGGPTWWLIPRNVPKAGYFEMHACLLGSRLYNTLKIQHFSYFLWPLGVNARTNYSWGVTFVPGLLASVYAYKKNTGRLFLLCQLWMHQAPMHSSTFNKNRNGIRRVHRVHRGYRFARTQTTSTTKCGVGRKGAIGATYSENNSVFQPTRRTTDTGEVLTPGSCAHASPEASHRAAPPPAGRAPSASPASGRRRARKQRSPSGSSPSSGGRRPGSPP